MYRDNAPQPAIEAPLGDFFAAGFGMRREISSIPVQMESGDGYNCYWPMPFHKRALITITNESQKNSRSFYYHIVSLVRLHRESILGFIRLDCASAGIINGNC